MLLDNIIKPCCRLCSSRIYSAMRTIYVCKVGCGLYMLACAFCLIRPHNIDSMSSISVNEYPTELITCDIYPNRTLAFCLYFAHFKHGYIVYNISVESTKRNVRPIKCDTTVESETSMLPNERSVRCDWETTPARRLRHRHRHRYNTQHDDVLRSSIARMSDG